MNLDRISPQTTHLAVQSARHVFMSDDQPRQITRRDEEIAKGEEYNRPLWVFKSGHVEEERQQHERARQGTENAQ